MNPEYQTPSVRTRCPAVLHDIHLCVSPCPHRILSIPKREASVGPPKLIPGHASEVMRRVTTGAGLLPKAPQYASTVTNTWLPQPSRVYHRDETPRFHLSH